jgi:hypothetical protein
MVVLLLNIEIEGYTWVCVGHLNSDADPMAGGSCAATIPRAHIGRSRSEAGRASL